MGNFQVFASRTIEGWASNSDAFPNEMIFIYFGGKKITLQRATTSGKNNFVNEATLLYRRELWNHSD